MSERVYRGLVLALACCLAQTLGPPPAQGQEGVEVEEGVKCDFSKYKPMYFNHFLPYAAVRKVEPKYPAIARAARAEGRVEVLILVDRNGDVTDACVVEGHPLLHEAAKSAALRWKFKKNFGLIHRQRRRYIQASLFFTFRLES